MVGCDCMLHQLSIYVACANVCVYIWQEKVDEIGMKGVKTRIFEAVKETMSWTREVAERGLSLLLRRRTECLVQVSLIYVWHTCEWVMAHIWMSHGTYEWVMLHIWARIILVASPTHETSRPGFFVYMWHDSLMCVTWLTYYVWFESHGAHMNESCHGTRMNESCHTCAWIWMGHFSHLHGSFPTPCWSLLVLVGPCGLADAWDVSSVLFRFLWYMCGTLVE